MYQSGIIKKYLGNSREIVVDIGSGGAIDNYLGKIAKDERLKEFIGIDIALKGKKIRRKLFSYQKPVNLHLICADAFHLPLRNSISYLTTEFSCPVFNKYSNLKPFEEMNRITKKGGYAILTNLTKNLGITTHMKEEEKKVIADLSRFRNSLPTTLSYYLQFKRILSETKHLIFEEPFFLRKRIKSLINEVFCLVLFPFFRKKLKTLLKKFRKVSLEYLLDVEGFRIIENENSYCACKKTNEPKRIENMIFADLSSPFNLIGDLKE